jgi:DNA polymerase I
MNRVLLIDAYNMIHRSRFGWMKGPDSITFNFFRALKSEIARHEATKVYIVSEGHPIHRMIESDGQYKANREKLADEGFHRQKREIFELCKYLPVTIIRHPDFECDDVIGTLAEEYAAADDKVIICSSDSDFIQSLVYENVSLWNPVKKKFIDRWPVDYLTWKGLKGDATDNVPGIKGVGEKTAFKLASDLNLLEEFLDKKPGRRETYNSAKRQITLSKVDRKCQRLEEKSYKFMEKCLFDEFKNREFKSIIGNAWQKWKNTMEKIDNETNR